ncbi:MAG: M28 family peptidase [Gemmatimonadota bacterium]
MTGRWTVLAVLATAPLAAQARPAETITEADVRSRVNIIADDSMGGRDTPSPGLEKTAQYVAREFQRMGLRPAWGTAGFFQRYAVGVRHIDPVRSKLAIKGPGGATVSLTLGRDAMLTFGAPGTGVTSADLVMVGGKVTDADKLDPAAVRGKGIVFAGDWTNGRPKGVSMVASAVLTGVSRFAILMVNGQWTYALPKDSASLNPMARAGGDWFLAAVRDSSALAGVAALADPLRRVRAAAGLTVLPLAGWTASFSVTATDDTPVMVPNVAAVLEGSDPELKREYVVISGHIDHVGTRCGGRTPSDSICNGADDDASGSAGVLEIAEAFAGSPTPPKRSIIFLAVSGEERGLWGSDVFGATPPVPIGQIVANLNMDQLGRNWKDTVVVIGTEHSDLGKTLATVAAEHPEIGMQPTGDKWPAENIYYRSDHFNFARRGVPILFFTSGFHPDYHQVTDSPDKVDAEKEARMLRLIYHVADRVANQPNRPRWNPESYTKIVDPSYRPTP